MLSCLVKKINPPEIWKQISYILEGFSGLDKKNGFLLTSAVLSLQGGDIREIKQATLLSTRTSAGSKSRRYRWRMMASAVLVWNQQRQSFSFHVRDFKRERLTPSFAIYNDAVYFRLTSVSKSRYYKERQVDRKKRQAIRWWFVSIRHGRHVLSQCPKQRHSPPEILKNGTNTGGKCLCLGHWLRTWRPWRMLTNHQRIAWHFFDWTFLSL